MRNLVVVASVAAVLLLAGTLLVWSGAYDVAADEPHWPVTRSILQALRTQSVAMRSADVQAPADLDSQKRIAGGAVEYAEMCAECHLAPGMASTELRNGLYPPPPDLSKRTIHDPRATFWMIKHGVKMTAMPAWGKSHDDQVIWELVAFVRMLPDLTVEQYRDATARANSAEHDHYHMEAPAASRSSTSRETNSGMKAKAPFTAGS